MSQENILEGRSINKEKIARLLKSDDVLDIKIGMIILLEVYPELRDVAKKNLTCEYIETHHIQRILPGLHDYNYHGIVLPEYINP